MDEKSRIIEKMKALAEQAKNAPKTGVKFTLKSGGVNSLNEVIKTKEQADFFMTLLKMEQEKANKQ